LGQTNRPFPDPAGDPRRRAGQRTRLPPPSSAPTVG